MNIQLQFAEISRHIICKRHTIANLVTKSGYPSGVFQTCSNRKFFLSGLTVVVTAASRRFIHPLAPANWTDIILLLAVQSGVTFKIDTMRFTNLFC